MKKLIGICAIVMIVCSSCKQIIEYVFTPSQPEGFTLYPPLSALHEPKKFQLNLPGDAKTTTIVADENTVTILLYNKNTAYLYQGFDKTTGKRIAINHDDFTNALNKFKGAESVQKLSIILKPVEPVSYKAIVDMLDEMHIIGIKKYNLAEPNQSDNTFVKSL